MATYASALKSKLIYVFAINDERHKNCLKIGETTSKKMMVVTSLTITKHYRMQLISVSNNIPRRLV